MASYPLSHMCLCAFDTNFFISRLSQSSLRVRSTTTPLWDHRSTGNAMHALRTQCELLDVGKYSHPSYLLVVNH